MEYFYPYLYPYRWNRIYRRMKEHHASPEAIRTMFNDMIRYRDQNNHRAGCFCRFCQNRRRKEMKDGCAQVYQNDCR